MTPIKEGLTPDDMSETEREVVEQMMTDRARLAEQRRALREARRQRERQFAVVVIICAVVCFTVGIAIAVLMWRPEAPVGSQSDAAGLAIDAASGARAEAPTTEGLSAIEPISAGLAPLPGTSARADSAERQTPLDPSLAIWAARSLAIEPLEHGCELPLDAFGVVS